MRTEQILGRKGSDVATVTPAASIADALAVLALHNVGALVVSESGTSVDGIVSERDIVRSLAASGAAVLSDPIESIAVKDVITCSSSDDIESLMSLMTDRRIRHLPVVDSGQLAGIVSIGDVVKSRIDELATERAHLVDYIQHGR